MRKSHSTANVAAAVETEARVIVKFRSDSSLMRSQSPASSAALPQHARALSSRTGLTLTDGRMLGVRSQVIKATGLSSRELADRLASESDVEYAVVDGLKRAFALPNDPLLADGQSLPVTPASGQWYLRAPTSPTIVSPSSIVASINAQAAWDITPGKQRVVVADIDTGVRFDHPDLASKLLPGYDFIANVAKANDQSARDSDPSDPGDYVTQSDLTNGIAGCTQADVGEPSSWHGTQTAGLIGAATNNGVGMASVGHDVMVLPLRVLGKCGGYDSDIQAAMKWAVGISIPGVPANPNPAKVLNLSLGSATVCTQGYADVVAQVNAAGAVIVAAAGNDGLAVGEPANCPGVIAVVGVRHAGTKVGYSDLGPNAAIAAPAGNCGNTAQSACLFPLLTTSNNGATTPNPGALGAIYTDGDMNPSLGTSFSSPLVAGTVALMLSANTSLTPPQVLAALQSTARAFPVSGAGAGVGACTAPTTVAQNSECYCTQQTCGAGLLDTGAAVARVAVLNANIDASATSVTAGATFSLNGSASNTTVGHSIVGYQWAISVGSDIAFFTTATNAPSVVLTTMGPGSVTVALTVVDDGGLQARSSVALSVASAASAPAAPPTAVPTAAAAPTSSGGGGAMQLGWMLGWLAAIAALWLTTSRRNPR
jgi:serine protease